MMKPFDSAPDANMTATTDVPSTPSSADVAPPVGVTPKLIEALQDPISSVKMQAIKALGRVGDPEAVPALLNALRGADEQMGSQIFTSLVRLGHAAVPGLIEASKSNSPWIRWHCIR